MSVKLTQSLVVMANPPSQSLVGFLLLFDSPVGTLDVLSPPPCVSFFWRSLLLPRRLLLRGRAAFICTRTRCVFTRALWPS